MSLHPTWHYRRSLASRVTLLTTMAVGLAVTAVSLASYLTVRTQSIRSLDESLHERALVASHYSTIQALGKTGLPEVIFGASDIKLGLLDAHDANNTVFYRADQDDWKPGSPEFAVAHGDRAWSARTTILDGRRYRMVAVPADEKGTALVLAQSLAPTDAMLSRLGLVALLIGLAGVIVAGLAGWGVARNGLRPVRRLTDAVEEISRTENLDPIPVEGNDEIARLATSFNTMLGSLSASRDRQRQLVADAGHELRTPLTSLRTNIELLAQAAGSDRLTAEARSEMLTDVQAQITELTTLIGDLVELARDDPQEAEPQTVELTEVVEAALSRVRRRAPGLVFDAQLAPWWLTGDASTLERAVTNLLDNAAKWSPAGGTVRIALADGTLTVADDGPGIAAADLPHVFDRFYRSAASRSMPGSGLGLSIVAAVAARHGGTVTAARSASGGALLTLSLPGSSTSPTTAKAAAVGAPSA